MARAAAILDEGFDVPTARRARRRRRGSGAARATGELSQAEILRPSAAARLRPPADPRRRLPGDPAGRARARARRRGAAACRQPGAPARAGRLASARRAAARRRVGLRRRCAVRPAQAMKKGAADSAVAYFRRAIDEPPPEARAHADVARARPGRVAHLRPGRGRAPARGLRRACTTRRRSGLAGNVLGRARCCGSRPRRRPRWRAAAAASMPPELRGRQRHVAARVRGGARSPSASTHRTRSSGSNAFRERRPPRALGEKAMAAVAAWQWATPTGRSTSASSSPSQAARRR